MSRRSAALRIRLARWRLHLGRWVPGLGTGADAPMPLWPLSVLLALLALPLLTQPLVVPDTLEMLAGGRCTLGLGMSEDICASLDPGRYPALTPMLFGLGWAAGLPPVLAAIGVGLVAGAALCGLCTAVLERTHRLAAALLPMVVLCTPSLSTHLFAGDGRGLALVGLIGAGAWLMRGTGAPWALGLWLCLAVLTRPESMIAAGLLGLVALRWRGRSSLWGLAMAGAALGAQAALQRAIGGARGWEMKLSSVVKILPDDWLFQLVGLGMGETPFRARLIASDLPSRASSTGALDWLLTAIPAAMPLWLGLGALGGLVVLARRREWRLAVVLGALATPSITLVLAAQAREQVLPGANLMHLLLAASLLSALALDAALRAAARRLRPGAPGPLLAALGAAMLIGLGTKSAYVPTDANLGLGLAADRAGRWLSTHTEPGTRVAVSFRTGGIPLVAERPRTALPSAWEVGPWLSQPDRPDLVVLSSQDSPGAHAAMRALDRAARLQLRARFGDATTELWIYGLSAD